MRRNAGRQTHAIFARTPAHAEAPFSVGTKASRLVNVSDSSLEAVAATLTISGHATSARDRVVKSLFAGFEWTLGRVVVTSNVTTRTPSPINVNHLSGADVGATQIGSSPSMTVWSRVGGQWQMTALSALRSGHVMLSFHVTTSTFNRHGARCSSTLGVAAIITTSSVCSSVKGSVRVTQLPNVLSIHAEHQNVMWMVRAVFQATAMAATHCGTTSRAIAFATMNLLHRTQRASEKTNSLETAVFVRVIVMHSAMLG